MNIDMLKLIDDKLLLYIKSLLSYVCLEYIFNIINISTIIIVYVICMHYKIKHKYSIVITIVLSIIVSYVGMNIAWAINNTEKGTLNIGICDVYNFNYNNYEVNDKYKEFSHNILTELKNNDKLNTSYENIIKTKYHRIKPYAFELLSANNVTDIFSKNKYKNKYDIIVYGIANKQNNLVNITMVSSKSNIPSDSLSTEIGGISKETIDLIFGNNNYKDIAHLIYILISQSISVSAANRFENSSIGINILSDAELLAKNMLDKHRNKIGASKASDRINFILKLNKSVIYKNMEEYDKSLEVQIDALKINPFYPFNNYEEFKRNYNLIYASAVAENILKLYESDKDKTSKEKAEKLLDKLNNYGNGQLESAILFYKIEQNILNCDDFNKCISFFEKSSTGLSSNAIYYLYLADSYKYYKSETMNINLGTIDKAIFYYRKAKKLDNSWHLLDLKIKTAEFLKCIKIKSGDFSACKNEVNGYERAAKPFVDSLDFRQFINNPD